MSYNITLVGNPNCGKTTLFNLLTGKAEKVGNRAGVTVETKSGRYKNNKNVSITDLPGMYSIKGGSTDERIAVKHLLSSTQTVVNVIDGANLKRSLRLTCELTRLKVPIVIAINFCDELEKNGIKIDVAALSARFNVPVVMISARKKVGIVELMSAAIHSAREPRVIDREKTEQFISDTVKESLTFTGVKTQNFTDKADKILMHKTWGIPIFAAVIFCVYFLTTAVGGYFGNQISRLFGGVLDAANKSLSQSGAAEWFTGLITGAAIKGVGTVVSFLPQILVLFFLLEIIEESGYMSRAAFLLDGIMEKFGLGGKSLVALGVSCGCAVSGVMTTRTIEDDNERRLTVFLSPFMPCGAKTAVFAWFTGLIFGGNPLISASLYFFSIISVALTGAVLRRFKRFRGASALIMEIPVLRAPSLKSVLGALKEKTVDFLLKAGSVIFLVSVAVWFLQSFGTHGYTTVITESFLFIIGDKIKVLFVPLGFGSWQAAVAVVASVFAKESVIQTLSMVAESPAALFSSAFKAYAFMAFILLAPPCTAALSAAYRELNSAKDFCFMLGVQTVAAYSVSLVINGIGALVEAGAIFLPLTILAAGVIISIGITVKKRGCRNCSACGRRKCRTKKANTII